MSKSIFALRNSAIARKMTKKNGCISFVVETVDTTCETNFCVILKSAWKISRASGADVTEEWHTARCGRVVRCECVF
jgi:hypothetical protein